jgi:hypothetical protein
MSAELDTPYDVILIWAFNFASITIESLDAKFPQLDIERNSEVFGGIY